MTLRTRLLGMAVVALLLSSGVASAGVTHAATVLADDQPPWMLMRQHGGVAYFLFAAPPHMERYDMDAEAWLPEITLAAAPTALAVDGEGIYVAFGPQVNRYNLDGQGEIALFQAYEDVTDLQVLGPYLYLHPTGHIMPGFSQITSIFKATGAIIDTLDCFYDLEGISIAPGIRKIFAHTAGAVPADILAITLNSDGSLGKTVDSPYHGDYPAGTRTYVFPGEARVAEDSGIIYNTNDLTYSNTLGGAFTDLAFYGDLPVVLREGELIAYSNVFAATGRYTPPVAPLRIAVRGDGVFAFRAQASGVGVAKIPIALLNPGEPGQPVDPVGLAYEPDGFALGQDETLYILSRTHLSIFPWSVAQRRYLSTIPLGDAPRYMAYSADTNRLYLAGPSGQITQIRLAESLGEQPFANLDAPAMGLATAGALVFSCNYYGTYWAAHHTLHPDGTPISRQDGNYYTEEYVWSSANRKMYFMNYNELFWQEIDANGAIGGSPSLPPDDITYSPPVRVAPDGSIAVVGSGSIHDAISLAQLGQLPNRIMDAAWSGGQLFTLRSVLNLSQLQKWGASYALVDARQFDGVPLRMFTVGEGLLVVTSYGGRPCFSIWSNDLHEVYHPPIADFTALPVTGIAPLTVVFTNESAGGSYTSSAWDFGDGATSDEKDPTHRYAAPGAYNVALTVIGPGGSDTVVKERLVTVLPSVPLYMPITIRP